jgi:hypothetical protein
MSLPTNYSEAQVASIWDKNFKDAMIAKAPYTSRWLTYQEAYDGDYFVNKGIPDYRSDMVSNYIFAKVETIRPIMLDNDPKFQSIPRQPEGMSFSNDINEAMLYEWDRTDMNRKLYSSLINVLVLGTQVYFIPWNMEKKQIDSIPINPFNIFPDPLATSVEDAEYIIYADYFNVNRLKKAFPKKAKQLSGSGINYSELVQDRDSDATIDNQVLVLEIWTRDYDTFVEDEKTKEVKLRYPNGRVLTICPELGIVLSDKPNPYDDGKFPFELIKDYEKPDQFWGEGEVKQLLSPQTYMNQLNNSIIDNAKATANMPWIVDKNAGIPHGKITARPGLVIRKNPGSEVRRDTPPSMPQYVSNTIESLKNDINEISGVHETLGGDNATGVYTAQGILALQEAGQVRIRLKVKLMENSLGKIANMFFSRMRQFWKDDKWILVTRYDGEYDLKMFLKDALQYDYDIKITAGSTMPVNRGAMLDLMIRLAQTPMPDGQMVVDREAVTTYLPEEVKAGLMRRMAGNQASMDQTQQMIQQLAEQLQQFYQEDQQADQQTMAVIEQITGAIEKLNQQILQLQEQHDKMVQEKVEEEKINKVKQDSYNTGYTDAEKMYEPEPPKKSTDDKEVPKGINAPLPEDIIDSLGELSDDELALLMMKNPSILDVVS